MRSIDANWPPSTMIPLPWKSLIHRSPNTSPFLGAGFAQRDRSRKIRHDKELPRRRSEHHLLLFGRICPRITRGFHPCDSAWLWNDEGPSLSNLVAMRIDTRATVAVSARRRSTSWGLSRTALAIKKATFGLDCLRKSRDCYVRCPGCKTRCGTYRSRNR
jgi:hypothetical protein